MRYAPFATVFAFLAFHLSAALAQTNPPATAPATTPPAAAPAAATGTGLESWWWVILIIIIIVAVVWYFMRGRATRV